MLRSWTEVFQLYTHIQDTKPFMNQLLTILVAVLLAVTPAAATPWPDTMLYCDKIRYIAEIVMSARQAGYRKNAVLRSAHRNQTPYLYDVIERMADSAWEYPVSDREGGAEYRVLEFGLEWWGKCNTSATIR